MMMKKKKKCQPVLLLLEVQGEKEQFVTRSARPVENEDPEERKDKKSKKKKRKMVVLHSNHEKIGKEKSKCEHMGGRSKE